MANFWYLHSRFALVSALTLSLGLVGTGCSGEGDDDDDDDSSTPQEQTPTPTPPDDFDGEIEITSPRDGQRIPLGQNQTVTVQFEVQDFSLREAGQCGSKINTCGRVKALVDGQANTETTSSPVVLDLSGLSSPVGEHTITLELVFDNGTSTGAKSEISIETTSPEAPDVPVPAITGPSLTDLHNLEDDGDQTFRFTLAVANFTFLREEGDTECEPYQDDEGNDVEVVNCGYAGILIDGEEGNNPSLDWNNVIFGEQNPDGTIEGEAHFTYVDEPTGEHEITVVLLQPDGTPYEVTAGQTTQQIQAVATFDIIEADAPNIHITEPLAGAPIKVGTDELMTFSVSFDVENFTLAAPGECGGNLTTCGHVHVRFNTEDEDGSNDGDAPGSPYNNAGASSPIDAYAAYLPEQNQTGLQTVTLSLHNDNHEAIEVDFGGSTAPVRSIRAYTLLPSDNPTVVIDSPADGASNVQISATNDFQATFRFSVTNFSLVEPGAACPADNENTSWDESEQCGYVQINVDGDDCNQSGQDYNNTDSSTPTANVLFDECNTAVGAHSVTFKLVDADGDEYLVNGDAVEHTIGVTTVLSNRGE